MAQIIDYTTMRKGKRVRGSSKIDVCPKCGRKGERVDRPSVATKHGWTVAYSQFNHIAETVNLGGFLMINVKDYCTTTLQGNGYDHHKAAQQ
jgi:hypothetical protein